MEPLLPPLAFFVLLFSGWINRQQQGVIDYLLQENRVRLEFAVRPPRELHEIPAMGNPTYVVQIGGR